MNPFHFPAIILASQSPRRAELLRQIGVPFDIVLPADPHVAEALEASPVAAQREKRNFCEEPSSLKKR